MSTGVCRWLILLISLSTWINHTNSKEMRVVCYYTNWSVYRPGTAKFSPQNINPYLCTHLIYAFGGFTKENTLKPFDKYQDIEKGGYAKFTGLKTYNKNLKTMLAIGGWNEGSSRFSPMVANPERRKELVKNAVKFLRQNHFDGLDLDWEYPSFRDGGKPRDRDNYAQLVKELREEFERESEKTGRSRLLLTMAVPAGIEYINKGYDIPKLTKYLDWMNILSYDYHSAFEPAVNHHAPLYSLEEASEYNYDTELNIDYTIQHYLELGADPNKLVMGIPTYGRSYTLFNPDANEIGAPADGPGEMGEATRENGYLAYYEVCENVKSQDWTVVQPNDKAMGPYAYKENQWVGYDDENIVRKKSEYVAENNLGGIMFWAIDNDDFRGNCHGRPYPLIEAAKEALLSAYGITEENLISPPAKPLKTKTRGRTRGSTKTEDAKDNTSTTKVSSNSRRRLRNKSKSKAEETRRKETRKTADFTSTYSSLKVVTPSYTTPAPPSTPDQGGSFKCEDEGFFPHPKDCKKYFWCLGGPGDTGIIAHQFTCPAGLYFNKAADSCDYTQNVLCNKKLARVTASTTSEKSDASTTTPKPTQSSVFSTTRIPPKITAATSRTTFRQTTTTEANFEDEEYEYDDEDGEDDRKIDSEEDPKVIKELIDLIRKAGGIEELEKQLKVGSGGSDFTTQSAISKTLYERVLSKAAKNPTSIRKNTYASLNRNSRGPQNDGIQNEEKTFSRSKEDRGRPQYTSIVRQRASPAKSENEDDKESEDKAENSKNLLRKTSESEYVNIRRSRISTTTQEPQQAKFNRNKILGEDTDEDKDTNLQISSPQYVNIRRQKPTTVEGSTTSKYTVIRRGSTTDSPPEDEADEEVTSKYKTIRRGTTAVPVTPDSVDDKNFNHKIRTSSVDPTIDNGGSTEKYLTIRRGSLTSTLSSVKFDNISTYKAIRRGSTTEPSSKSTTYEPASDVTTRYKTISRTLPTSTVDVTTGFADEIATTEPLTSTSPNTININNDVNLLTTKLISEEPTTTDNKVSSVAYSSTEIITDPVPALPEKKSPQLLEPRPFSLNTRGTTSTKSVTESTTQASKVSDSNFKFRLKPKASDLHIGVVSSQNSPTTEHLKQKQRNFSKLDLNDQDEPLHSTPNSLNRARKRFFTTEAYIEKEVNDALDQSRTFRPSDIADLSSLTAVDFDVMKKFNGEVNHKRGRPRIASTETGTTTEKIEEPFKTASRYLQVRKETNSGNVVKNKRVFPTQHSDQINSSSNVNSTSKRLRGANKTLEEIENTSPANRRIIRRFRTTERSSTTNDQILSTSTVRSLRKPGRYTSRFTEITNRSGPTVQSTTDNLEHILNRRPTRLPFGQNQSDNEDNSTDDLSTEEDENIKLSESNIRENSDINNISGGKKSSNADLNKSKVKELHSKSDLDEKPTNQKDQTEAQEKVETKPTEPNIIVRTRKIVRKLKPTEATLLDDHTATTLGTRKRKIIRRIRPSSTIAPEEIATAQKDVYITNSENKAKRKKIYIRGRPTTGNFEISTEKLENPNNNSDLNKSIFDSKQANLDDDGPEVTRIVKKPLYRSRTSTTGSADISSTPRYSVYTRRPSTTAGDSQISSNSEEEDDDTESEEIDSDDAVATLAPENVNDTTTTTIESTIYENNKTVDDLEHSDENKDIAEEQLDENENSKENKTTKVETSTVRNHLLRRQKDRPSFTRPKLSNLSKPGEATDKSSESLYRKKERPTFTRSRSTTTSTSQPDIIGRPKYRTFSRTTTSATTLTSTSSTTPTSVINSTDALDETLLNIEHNKTNNVTETISSVPDILETTTEGFTTVEITTILDKSTSEAINITTSTEAVTLNPLDHIIKTTTENFTLTTEADLIATNNTLEDKEDLATTVNILDVDDLNVTVSSPTDDITSTGKISVTTVASEIDGISPKNDSTFDGLVSSTESNSTETTTPYVRRSTLKPINARPKLSPKRNFTTTQATTESVKSYRNQNRFKIRTHPTTENSVIQNKIRSSSPLPINKSIYKYRTTERNIYKAPLDEKEEQNKEETEDNVEDEEQTDDRHEEVYDDYDEEDTSEEKDEDQLTKVSHIRPPGYKSELASKRPPTRVVNKPISLLGKSNKPSVPNRNRTANKPPLFRKSTTIRSTNKPSFAKTTEAPVTEDLSDINTEAVKNRNKNLFAKKRKMNTPFAGPTLETSSVADNTNVTEELITLAPQITEPVTKSSVQQTETTEFLTTLHHIFAEVNDSDTSNPETTTESINTTSSSSNGKVERLIEVNRIIEVKTKEAKVHSGIVEEQTKTQLPTIDKIGAVNRITFIQVVGGNSSNATIIEKTLSTELNEIKINQTDAESNNLATTNKPPVTINIDGSFIVPEIAKVEEITPAKSSDPVYENPFSQRNREDRKFEIYGESKVIDYSSLNKLYGSGKDATGKAEIIDGISHINIITPRPVYSTEASTIALQGLFQTDTPQTLNKNLGNNEELLETDHSRFVNVRILGQDENLRDNKGIKDHTKLVPIKILSQDEEVTMKAEVVEVKPRSHKDVIKIVPIRVEMSRKLAHDVPKKVQTLNSPFLTKVESGVPKVNIKLITPTEVK